MNNPQFSAIVSIVSLGQGVIVRHERLDVAILSVSNSGWIIGELVETGETVNVPLWSCSLPDGTWKMMRGRSFVAVQTYHSTIYDRDIRFKMPESRILDDHPSELLAEHEGIEPTRVNTSF